MAKVPVYDDGEVVARVEYNSKLDFWDGRNMTSGSTGRHLGYTRLKSGKFVLIHGTQWQGEQVTAEVVTPEELVQAAARTGHLDEIYTAFPELKGTLEEEEMEAPVPEAVEVEVVAFGNGAHITLPKDLIGRKVRYTVVED
jgi:putative transposon-encoded protein